MKLYPTLIIPPIPSKQSLSDYAVKQGKAKEDAAMIARRKRTLQTFLNRIARHPILSNEHVYHRFLDGEVSWVCDVVLCLNQTPNSSKTSRLKSFTHPRYRCCRRIFSKLLHITPRIPMHHLHMQHSLVPRHRILYGDLTSIS